MRRVPCSGAKTASRRWAKPNTGVSEHKSIASVTARHSGFTYPSVAAVIEIEVAPVAGTQPQS